MSEHQEVQAIVEKLNSLEARYTRAKVILEEHQTPDAWIAFREVVMEYEQVLDLGQVPVWNKTEGTYVIE